MLYAVYTNSIYEIRSKQNIYNLYMQDWSYSHFEKYDMILTEGTVTMMFLLADNKEIGQYLMSRIDNNKRFGSRRQFCREYLAVKGEQTDNERIGKMANRLSQILKGEKGIQLYDLPLFCQLLEVSCEDILSAGKCPAPASTRLTNYAAAFSQDEQEWETYVNREDSPILNADEFGKTFIDYALEARNYKLLKYLMGKGYIWFVGPDEQNHSTYFTGFGAGTSIEKKTFPYPRNLNVLDAQLKMRDELRTHMTALAIQHRDIEMLDQLHAREIPSLYQISAFSSAPTACEQYYNAELMDVLTHADNGILEYFSEEFEITDRVGFSNRFLFPFIGELIERLLQNNRPFAEYMLKDAIRHNQSVYDQLSVLLTDAVNFYKRPDYDMTNIVIKNDVIRGILRYLNFFDGDLVSYFALLPGTKKGLRSNIIQVNAKSADTVINRLITELNELYNAIRHITPRFEGGKEQ